MIQHLLTLSDWNPTDISSCLDLAADYKKNPSRYAQALNGKILMMIFEKPSLRTRLSFETGMLRLGGHAIYYDTSRSPMGAGKESVKDTVKVASRFVDGIMARLFEHHDLEEMAKHAEVPIINGLTNFNHPCQILADLLTIRENKGTLSGLTLAYFGDSNNNVTHSLMVGCAKMGMHVHIACPDDPHFKPDPVVWQDTLTLAQASGSTINLFHNPLEAAHQADILYTDTWMSYHISHDEQESRVAALMPFQINQQILQAAHPEALFMNCLPAQRGFEQTAEVIDGPASVVYDQAENRMHAQNAVLLRLLTNQY